ncbi:MAG: hypothetical protein LUC47_04335 [Clostridiales bacterium]|nr:hypothetical protein [Clostridiales bacterium]
MGACLSGTGPTVFGVFQTETEAQAAAQELRETYQETFVVQPV